MSIASALKGMFGEPYAAVSAGEAAAMADDGAFLLDVREPHEWHAGHAPMASHIPLGQLHHRTGELPRGRSVITVCRSGARSAKAAALLAREGLEVFNLSGGMHAWSQAGLPVVAKDGGRGQVA